MSRTALDTEELLSLIAERLEHIGNVLERPEPAPLPSKWARVHAMGNNSYAGEVEALPRGAYRITYYDSEVTEADYPAVASLPEGGCAIRRVKDIRAVHSVDWLTQAQYEEDVEEAQKAAAQNFQYLQRKKWPKGYELAQRNRAPGYAFRRLSDGRVCGFYWNTDEARQYAWSDFDEPSDFKDLRGELDQPGTEQREENDLDDDFPGP